MKFEFMPRYTKYLCWYQTEMRIERSIGYLGVFTIVCLLLILFVVLSLSKCSNNPQPAYKSHYSPEEVKMIKVFTEHGSTHPEEMAVAVTKTKRPALMAAMAIRESNGRPKAVGDSGASKGAFQVQEKHWAKVGTTATEQALQAEKILDELVASTPRRSLYHGLAKYNGGVRPPKVSYQRAAKIIKLSRIIRKDIENG